MDVKVHCDELYTGKISVKKLSTEMYTLVNEDKLEACLKQIVCALDYYIK